MSIKKYDELDPMQLDVLKEIGSVGAGNAATALSSTIQKRVKITVPDVKILDYNSAIKFVGLPELVVAGELVEISGSIQGTMLFIQTLDFVNLVLENVLNMTVKSLNDLSEIELSAINEIGNIIINSYLTAISSFAEIEIDVSVPATSVNMLGAIMALPMIKYGYEADKIMIIDVNFVCDETEINSSLILVPSIVSLNHLLEKLGVNIG